MKEARGVLMDPVRFKLLWEDAMECDRVSRSPWGLWNYMTGVKDFDGNVMLYEVRTALDFHGIFPVPSYKRSRTFEVRIERAMQDAE